MLNRTAVLVFLAWLLGAAACGSRDFVAAQGRVTLDGQPLEGAAVMFYPDSGQPLPAHGETIADGRFTLATVNNPGARPGSYKVVVTKLENETASRPAGPGKIIGKGSDKEALPGPEHAKRSPMRPAARNSLPAAYADPNTTPLRAEIPAGGAKNLEIKLTSRGD